MRLFVRFCTSCLDFIISFVLGITLMKILCLLQNLRLEENPILDLPHVEAAFMLLVGPNLKKFNDRGRILFSAPLVTSFPVSEIIWNLMNIFFRTLGQTYPLKSRSWPCCIRQAHLSACKRAGSFAPQKRLSVSDSSTFS